MGFPFPRLQLPPAHRIARINYVPRTTSFAYSFLVVCLFMFERGVDLSTTVLAILTLLVYPHLAYAHASIAVDSKRAEFRNLTMDSVLMGVWIAQMQFALWPSCGALVGISLDNVVCGGAKRLATGLLWGAAAAWAWSAANGYPVRLETGPLLTAFCFAGIFGYVISLALFLRQQNERLRRTRNTLSNSEAQFRFIAEHAGDLVAVLDPRGRIRYASPSHADHFAAASFTEGRDWLQLVHPHDRAQAQAFITALLSARQHQRTKLLLMPVEGDLLLVECDGNAVRDDSGAVQMIVLVARNLSARARTEVDLRLAARAYDRLAEGVLICDSVGRIEFVNQAYTKLLGHAAADIVGKHADTGRSGLPSARLFDEVLRSFDKDDIWQGSYLERGAGGELLMLTAVAYPLRDAHGKVVHMVWTVHGNTALPYLQSS